MILNKERIRWRFARAADTYDDQAVIQRRVADRLMHLVGQHAVLYPRRVLEIGCCTGLLTRRLAESYPGLAKLYVNDLVPEFEKTVAERIPGIIDFTFLQGDIESITLPDNLDLILSSSTFHWLENLPSLIARLPGHMSPEGILAFSMYSKDNFHEIREITGTSLHYYEPEELKELVGSRFQILSFEEELIRFTFNDPLDILHHLQKTGVNALDKTVWTFSRLQDFIRKYRDRFSDQGRVYLTYHPVYCVACNAPEGRND